MHTYCKLKDGREMVVWSDNVDDETMNLFPVSDLENYDPEYIITSEFKYEEILRTDTNREIAFA